MEIVSRAGWNARPPTSMVKLNFSMVSRFVLHYSGASRSQSVRSIQDYCMDTKGHSDIDYNYIVKEGAVYIGRGDNIGSHTLGNNSSSIGVCVVGMDGDATDADFAAIRALYDGLTERIGKPLAKTTHRMVLGASYTDCPGDEIEAWVRAGMPYPEGGDVAFTEVEKGKLDATDERVREALILGRNYTDDDPNIGQVTPWIVSILTEMNERLKKLEAGGSGSIVGKEFTATGTFTS